GRDSTRVRPITTAFDEFFHWVTLGAVWVAGTVVVAVVYAGTCYVAWLRRNFPWKFGWKAILVSLGFGVAVNGFGLWINPPSEVRKALENQNRPLQKSK